MLIVQLTLIRGQVEHLLENQLSVGIVDELNALIEILELADSV